MLLVTAPDKFRSTQLIFDGDGKSFRTGCTGSGDLVFDEDQTGATLVGVGRGESVSWLAASGGRKPSCDPLPNGEGVGDPDSMNG